MFCSSSPDVDERYMALARDLGDLVAQRRWRLIYGGGRRGLMGAAADAALEAGAEVEGVIPQHLVDREVAHQGLTRLHITETMQQRQFKMSQLADAFVVLPGGLGTLAEFFEIVTWKQIALHNKPIALLNFEGFWDPLIAMIEQAQDQKFLHGARGDLFQIVETLKDLPDIFEKKTMWIGS